MAEGLKRLDMSMVNVGDRLPDLVVPITATTIVLGASATRDFQPQHHDHAWVRRVGLRDIIMNTQTQGGWISRYVTDWTGPAGRLARVSYRMKDSICPGDTMVISGTVTATHADDRGCGWIDILATMTVDDTVRTSIALTVAVPASAEDETPWQCTPDQWRIADLPPLPAHQ